MHSLVRAGIQDELRRQVVKRELMGRVQMTGENAAFDLLLGGRYLDRLEKRHDEWRISRRTLVRAFPGYERAREMSAQSNPRIEIAATPR